MYMLIASQPGKLSYHLDLMAWHDLPSMYVVPRGKIAHDTTWAMSALEPYKGAWHWLKEFAPLLFERKVEALSKQLRTVIEGAAKRKLPYELIPSKRGVSKRDYRTFAQRRIIIKGKRCAIFTASLIPDRDQAWDGAVFKTPKGNWPEVLLYMVDEDIYVVPRDRMPQETSLSLDSSRIYDYRNSWCVLDGVDPTSWAKMREYRRRIQSEGTG